MVDTNEILKNYGWKIAVVLNMVIFWIGIIRMFLVILHSPLLGYANNYDMVRLQACQQIWPSDPMFSLVCELMKDH